MKSVLFVVLAAVLCLSAGVRADEQPLTAVESQSLDEQLPTDIPQAVDADADETDSDDEEGDVSLAEVAAETSANEAAVQAAQSATESEADQAADIAAHMEQSQQAEVTMEGPAPIARMAKRGPARGPARKVVKRRPIIAPAALRRVKFHSERVEARGANRFEDPEMGKLNLALEAVKQDILSTNKQINDERKWVIAVAKIIASYNDKMKRVETHIIALRKEMKALYRKKKQIENLKLQKALEAKLKEAREELATLTNSLKHVAVKQGELNRSGADLRQTIAGIQSQLAKLRGQRLRKPRPAAKGKGKRRGGRRGKGRKGRKGGRRGKKAKRCRRGMRFSKRAKRCVPAKRR